MLPYVKAGEGLEEKGDFAGALVKYQQAMDGFRAQGVKRPKLKEKMDQVKVRVAEKEQEAADQLAKDAALLGIAADEPEPAGDDAEC
jgi:hypothetical protein